MISSFMLPPRRTLLEKLPLQRVSRRILALSIALATAAAFAETAAKTAALEVEPTNAAVLAQHAPVFIRPSDIDYKSVLPEPPKPETLAGRADLEAVIQAQEWRTPEQIAWAKRVAKIDIFHSADVLGPWFTKQNLPALVKLVDDLNADVHGVSAEVKKIFARARPYAVDPSIKPCVSRPSNDSYPSGHTLRFFVFAHVLSELRPAKRVELFKFAHKEAWGRVWGGVHFPSDLVGGWLLADAVAVRLKQSAAFRERLAACRAEMDAAERKFAAR